MTNQAPSSPFDSHVGDDLSPGRLAEIACLLEVTARKPGNVHRFADLPGLYFTDFLLSAAAIAGPFDQMASQGVGAVVLAAIQATRRVVSTNTNLGIVLLLAPLAAVPEGIDLACGVETGPRRDDRRRRVPGLSRDPARTAGWDGRSTRSGREQRSDDDAA